MKDRYLEVTFHNGKPLAAYLCLPRTPGVRSAKTAKAGAGILVDYSADGQVIGLEITAPTVVTPDQINAVLENVGQPRIAAEELSPLAAA